MVGSAGLDRPALSQLCLQQLGSQREQVGFEAGYLSQVVDLRLTDGRDVVVKVRAWQQRLISCGQAQQSRFRRRRLSSDDRLALGGT